MNGPCWELSTDVIGWGMFKKVQIMPFLCFTFMPKADMDPPKIRVCFSRAQAAATKKYQDVFWEQVTP